MTKWYMSFSGQFILGSGNSFFLSRAGGYGGFVCDGALRGGGGGGGGGGVRFLFSWFFG